LALGLLLRGASASAQRDCAAEGSCAAGGTLGNSLLQGHAAIQKVGLEGSTYQSSGCAQRLGHGSSHPAACVVIKDNKALLVWVPYGSSPGWDLPGGLSKGGEAPCETAEREVCEETHMSVRAIGRISSSTFRCEITGYDVCRNPTDEGFLRTEFFYEHELDGLQFRGGSWGDKVGKLRRAFAEGNSGNSPPPVAPPNGISIDACGCRPGIDGWSTTTQECKATSQTSPREAIGCQRRTGDSEFDVCGCKKGVQGWSSSGGRCSATSETSPSEADECRSM